MRPRAYLCWCDGHRAGLFSVVPSVSVKGNSHKLKHRNFCLYVREIYIKKSTRVPFSPYLGTIGMGCNWGGHCPLPGSPSLAEQLPAPGQLDSNSVGNKRKSCSESFISWPGFLLFVGCFFGFFFSDDILPDIQFVLTEDLGMENEIKHFRINCELGLEGATIVGQLWMEEGGEQGSFCFF